MQEQEPVLKRARMPDIDDSLMGRWKLTRFFGMVMGKIKPSHLPDISLEDVASMKINHDPVEGKLGGFTERFSYWVHSFRKLYAGVPSRFESYAEEGVDIIPATGRSSSEPWPTLTEKQMAPVSHLVERVSYTPRGVRTVVSKVHTAWLLLETDYYGQQYDGLEIDEDDPRAAELERSIFAGDSRVSINYIPYETTSKLDKGEKLTRLPNVRRTPGLYEGEATDGLEARLVIARQQIQTLGTLSELTFLIARNNAVAKTPDFLKGSVNSLIFDRCLGRFDSTFKVWKIAESVAGELNLDGLSASNFRDMFAFRISKELRRRWSTKYPLLVPEESAAEERRYSELLETEMSIIDDVREPYGMDLNTAFRNLAIIRSAGSRTGQMLINPEIEIAEVVGTLESYVNAHNKLELVASK